jgi:glucose/arabinose dehydrogenase
MPRRCGFLLVVSAVGCGDNVDPIPAGPPPASVAVTVEVPTDLAGPPFDEPRTLLVPPGFGIRVIARIPGARFLAETPEGDLLVSRPGNLANRTGQIFQISDIGTSTAVTEIASGLTLPHDLVFTRRAGVTYLYVAEHDRISRAPWIGGAPTLGRLETVVPDLPSVSLPELGGNYGHALKNIAIDGETLYVSIASTSNAHPSDILADPVRGSIYVYPVDGGAGRLYGTGIRNAEGLAIHPRTGELWVVVNHRDNIRYPLRDGRYPYGELVQDYIDDNPPEQFTRVRDGGNYGWPYCNPTADAGYDNMPYHPDIDNNEDKAVLDCDSIDRTDKGLPAHSAPLGMSFWTGDAAPILYRDSAVIGMHGCWNCAAPRGYKVAFLPMRSDNGFAKLMDLVAGFLTDPDNKATVWGRPVDAIPNRAGNLYISDDHAGVVYELYRK